MTGNVIVAGHICLDIIPSYPATAGQLLPGSLTEVGPATLAPGGGVSNVGLSLLRLGVDAQLMGKVGDDAFGAIVRNLLEHTSSGASRSIVTAPGESTSYTVVLSPPGVDRSFLHHAGCNDSFSGADVDLDALAGTAIFYLGYPPLMRRFYEDEGRALASLLRRVTEAGVATAVDMAMPDPRADSGRVDWRAFLERILPHVDIFTPSRDETLFMLDRARFDAGPSDTHPHPLEVERSLADSLLEMGAGIVGLTLGERGLYLRSASRQRVEKIGGGLGALHDEWANRELWAPVFRVLVQGTTGSGDATTAGFLGGLLKRLGPEETVVMAVAVGACSVEAADATSGVRSWDETRARVASGWEQRETEVVGWRRDATGRSYAGPRDQEGRTP